MDDDSGPMAVIVILLIFILWIGLLNTLKAALEHISEGNAEREAENGNKQYSAVMELLDNPYLLNNTIQVVTMLFGMICGVAAIRGYSWRVGSFFEQYIGFLWGRITAYVVIIFIFMVLSLSLGYLAPYKIGTHFAEACAPKLAGFAKFCSRLIFPAARCIELVGNLLVRIFGIDPYRPEDDVTEDEIIDLVDEAHEQGVIQESEAEMIQNIMEFGNKSAKDIMTHRIDINAIDSSMELEQALDIMFENNNTRYPVYQDDIDNITGIVLLKDAVIQLHKKQKHKVPLGEIKGLIRSVVFVPETRGIDSIFKVMQAKKVHMAIVVDEYGQTSGIVTMEDILEEIVGNILDEYDDNDDFIQPLYDKSILMDGLTPLEQVEEVLSLDFEDQDFDTLNGYLTNLLGHIPTKEDKEVAVDGFVFQILSIDNNVIRKIRVIKTQKEEESELCQDIQNLQT